MKPNVLLITTDCLRYDALQCNGNALALSPHLDALASEGLRLERAYCSQPLCMPCRASIMTGRYPSSHGVWENGVPLGEDSVVLPAVLGAAGYRSACHGKFHFRPWLPSMDPDESAHLPEHRGETEYFGFSEFDVVDHSTGDAYVRWVREHHPEAADLACHPARERPPGSVIAWKSRLPVEATKSQFIADRCIATLRRRSEDGDPFFVWASFFDPHHPYNPPEPYASLFDDVEFPAPPHHHGVPADLPAQYHDWARRLRENWGHVDTAQNHWQQVRRLYQGKVAHVDHQIGRVLAALKESGQYDNTIIVFLSDHGTFLGDYGLMQIGNYAQEPLVRLPMILKAPGMSAGISRALVSTVDIMPTLLDLTDVSCPAGVQGKSLRAVLAGGSIRDQLLVESRWGRDPRDAFNLLVTERHKLALYGNGTDGELYDLADDPREMMNRFHDPSLLAVRRELAERLAVELIATKDPLPGRVGCW